MRRVRLERYLATLTASVLEATLPAPSSATTVSVYLPFLSFLASLSDSFLEPLKLPSAPLPTVLLPDFSVALTLLTWRETVTVAPSFLARLSFFAEALAALTSTVRPSWAGGCEAGACVAGVDGAVTA